MGAIDFGDGAINRAASASNNITSIDLANPANDSGVINSVELWFSANGSGVKIGSFYGSGNNWTNRGGRTIGAVTAGSKQTFTGFTFSVQTNDRIGGFWSGGTMEIDSAMGGGTTYKFKGGDQFGTGLQTYSDSVLNQDLSMYGTGVTAGWANIAEVKTVAAADIAEVNTVAVADIAEINGVAVFRLLRRLAWSSLL